MHFGTLNLPTWKVQLQHTCMQEGGCHTQRQNANGWLLLIEINNDNCYKHVKIKSQFPNSTQTEPVDGRTLTERWPANDRRIHCRPPAIDRSPNGHRWASGRSSAGHRRGIDRNFGHFLRKSNGGRTVSWQRPSGARWQTLRHGSRSRKSADEVPISKNRHWRKICRSPLDLWSIVTSA